MDEGRLKVLLVEDDEDDYILAREFLAEIRGANFQLDWVGDYDAGLEAIQKDAHDVYLVDYRLGKGSGLANIEEHLERRGKTATADQANDILARVKQRSIDEKRLLTGEEFEEIADSVLAKALV